MLIARRFSLSLIFVGLQSWYLSGFEIIREALLLIIFYSLGTVLLEIGLWQSLETFETEDESAWEFRDRLVGLATRELPGQVGQIYARVVQECLRTSRDDKDEDTQEKLCWQVVSMLDQCVA